MNFQDLKKVESADFYLDVAFRRTSEQIEFRRKGVRAEDNFIKQKKIEIMRVDILKDFLKNDLQRILNAFPDLESLDPFYNELVKCTLDYPALKKSLGSLNWASRKIEAFSNIYRMKFKNIPGMQNIGGLRREYFGRMASVLKQIKDNLAYLDTCRKVMKNFPAIKTSVFTVCIFGFPNVGKSTLLTRLTSATPEINSYPFTTKSLNLGYLKEPGVNVQIVDTPGTLNRVDKMNLIELQAYLAVKHLAAAVVYVFDSASEYEVKKQEKLFERLKEFDKPIILYLSKTDIAEKEVLEKFREDYPGIISSTEEIRAKIIEFIREQNTALLGKKMPGLVEPDNK
jgi:nucleolar GTP-binding protein